MAEEQTCRSASRLSLSLVQTDDWLGYPEELLLLVQERENPRRILPSRLVCSSHLSLDTKESDGVNDGTTFRRPKQGDILVDSPSLL